MRTEIQPASLAALVVKLALSFLILSLGTLAEAQEPAQMAVGASTWRNEPASPERTERKIEEAALKYQAYAPIPRVVLYDIGYPGNREEYVALDYNAVILVTSLSQVQDELPLKRVYLVVDGKEIELKHVKTVLSEQQDTNSQTVKTFGAYRADELFLLPAYLRLKTADVLVDFAKNKVGHRIATFGGEISGNALLLSVAPPTGKGPDAKALEDFIRREYPGFF